MEETAFLPVTHLAEIIRTKQITSVELTEMYLDRLKRYGPTLNCVVTLTEERGRRQAREADREIAAGRPSRTESSMKMPPSSRGSMRPARFWWPN